MRKLILFFGMLFIVTSCNNNDDELNPIIPDNNNTPDHEIVATWNLVKFEQFGPLYEYNNGEIKWTFNSDNTVNVVIENGTDLSSNLPINVSGVFSYNITQSNNLLNLIKFNNEQNYRHTFQILNNKLVITDTAGLDLDGYQLTFELAE